MAENGVSRSAPRSNRHGFTRGLHRPPDRQQSVKDPTQVRSNTKVIFERLLNKKLGCRRRKYKMAIGVAQSDRNLNYNLQLDLPTDIEGDGISETTTPTEGGDDGKSAASISTPLDDSVPHHLDAVIVERTGRDDEELGELFPTFVAEGPRAPDTAPTAERTESTGEDLFAEIALVLGSIGDEINSKYQRDVAFQQEMRKCANLVASQLAYQAFEKTVDSFLDRHRQYIPDAREHYQVAFIFLCVKTALTTTSNLVAATDNADTILDNAVDYVATRFPDWIGTAIE